MTAEQVLERLRQLYPNKEILLGDPPTKRKIARQIGTTFETMVEAGNLGIDKKVIVRAGALADNPIVWKILALEGHVDQSPLTYEIKTAGAGDW